MFLNTNSYKVNSLSRNAVSKIVKILDEKIKVGVPIPLFAFSGISAISGYGKKINYKTLSLADVNCMFDSNFTSVGINQTLHSIYCNFTVEIYVMFPLNNEKVENSSKILITESVLVGEVPDFYLSKVLNLG